MPRPLFSNQLANYNSYIR